MLTCQKHTRKGCGQREKEKRGHFLCMKVVYMIIGNKSGQCGKEWSGTLAWSRKPNSIEITAELRQKANFMPITCI